MLSRRYLASAVLGAGLALTAAVPALAATPTATATPTTTTTVSATPQAVPLASGLPCYVVVTKDGKRIIQFKPSASGAAAGIDPGATTEKQAEICKKLLARKQLGLAFPKGAPQTGGGGMAAEVSSWG